MGTNGNINTDAAAMKVVVTSDLQVGDIVRCHGSRFRLVECSYDAATAEKRVADLRKYRDAGVANTRLDDEAFERECGLELTLRAFRTEYLGAEHSRAIEVIPAGWRREWVIQGNHFAQWSVEVQS